MNPNIKWGTGIVIAGGVILFIAQMKYASGQPFSWIWLIYGAVVVITGGWLISKKPK